MKFFLDTGNLKDIEAMVPLGIVDGVTTNPSLLAKEPGDPREILKRICELVRYYLEDVTLKGAWSGPAALQFFDHAMCDVNRLPVREVLSASHYITDLTLGLGEVVHDYLA